MVPGTSEMLQEVILEGLNRFALKWTYSKQRWAEGVFQVSLPPKAKEKKKKNYTN